MFEEYQNLTSGAREERGTESPEGHPEIGLIRVAELREPMQKILQAMRENIEQGDYVAILGEDASGRIPALIFRKIFRRSLRKEWF